MKKTMLLVALASMMVVAGCWNPLSNCCGNKGEQKTEQAEAAK
jgi:protein involved in sex pheromone biosynthesis